MKRTPAALEAENTPPSCLSGYVTELRALMPGQLKLSVEFALSCSGCGARSFRLLGHPVVVPNPSPYFGLKPGEILFRPPHRTECASCGRMDDLFDIRTQGYDGVLNGGGSYESGTDGEAAMPGRFELVVTFYYNIELDELQPYAQEGGVNPSDLFDWISIVGTALDDGEKVELSYECA